MVRGLEIFQERFAAYVDQYVLIGGTAASLTMDAYFSDRGRLFQADRGRRIGVAVAALGKRAGTGVNVS